MTSEVDWRRRWKPGLEGSPWQSISVDGKPYLLKHNFTQDSYEILFTDLSCFWFEELSGNALKKRLKKLNPGIEAPLTRMLDQIQGVLDRQQDGPDKDTAISLVFREDENVTGVMLKISSHLSGLPFSWNFQCKPADKALTSEHLTMPLMTMVGELTRRQQELIKIIEMKDKEIDDYKSQGAKTTRKHIETVSFVETAFEMNMMTSKGLKDQVQDFGLSTFDAKGQDLYRQIMCKRAWINRSPGKDSGDDDSLLDDMSTQGGRGGRKRSADSSWGNSRLPPSLVGSRSPTKLASQSPTKSPTKSPRSSGSEASPVKDSELLRRQALERRLEDEENKKMEKSKKKKKIAF